MALSSLLHRGLTGNQLKILAMIAMTLDHIGMYLFPGVWILRILGRLSLPIYAYMIAEGCAHTRSMGRYLLRVASVALLCQVVYFLFMDSLYQCILVTFCLSILLIWAVERAVKNQTMLRILAAFGALFLCFFVCELLPDLLVGTDFKIDYGFIGVLLPVLVYFSRKKVLFLGIGLVLLALGRDNTQWWALAALPLLMLYNHQRGSRKIGPLFYFYYPAHLAVLYGIKLFIN